jgi:hypothetical protein
VDIYTRLYTYRDTPSKSPSENFLTEALADIFNRLPILMRIELLVRMLPESCANRLRRKCEGGKQIKAITQVSIVAAGSLKRPDIIVYLDSKPLVLLEVKVHAPLQEHRIEGSRSEGPYYADNEIVFQSQLTTYSKWISSQSCGDWAGAVVFLTHRTRAPAGFDDDGQGGNSVIGATRTWKDIGSWLATNLDLSQSEMTYCALAWDFNHFLERQGLMADFMSSRDLAATALFMSSYRALEHTFKTVITAVASKYQRSKGGKLHWDFWPEGNVYWAWYNLNNQLNPAGAKFFIAVGICFPDDGAFGSNDLVGVPKHGPFFFVMVSDTSERKKASDLLSKIPEGWVEIPDQYTAIAIKAVSQFEADPDVRAQSLIDWAQAEVGRVVACIPNFDDAPVQIIAEDAEG